MATKTSNYEFNKPEQNDFYDVDVQNENWDKVDEELSEFDDSGVTEDIKSFPDFLSKFVTGNKVAITLRNLKAGLQFVLHAGQIVNNCVTDNAGLPLSAAQGKVLKDLYTQLYSEMGTKFSLFGGNEIPKGADLHTYLTTGNYYYPQTATIGTLSNCPMNEAFRLKVTAPITNKNGSYILQEYTSFTGKSAAGVAYDPYNNVWGKPTEFVTKDDLTPAFTKVGSGYGLEAYHAAIGGLHILRLAGNVTSSFSKFDLALPDSCNGYFISEFGKIGEISYTIEMNSKHLKITPSTSISAGKYFIHWLIYYGE